MGLDKAKKIYELYSYFCWLYKGPILAKHLIEQKVSSIH